MHLQPFQVLSLYIYDSLCLCFSYIVSMWDCYEAALTSPPLVPLLRNLCEGRKALRECHITDLVSLYFLSSVLKGRKRNVERQVVYVTFVV